MNKLPPPDIGSDHAGEFIIYRTEADNTEVHLRLVGGTVWMTQAEMSDLFGVTVSTISRHISNIYEDGDLTRESTFSKHENVAVEQGRQVLRRLDSYNLDMVIAVGYRVRGPRGAQFRAWATLVLKDYLIKGFAMNDEKLKDPSGKDYFDELLERIRDIRSSEARFYQQIRDLIATAVDYSPKSAATTQFFANIQNKLHFAVTGQTASEILATRSDPTQPNMGLTSFSGKKVRKQDVTVAKNYLLPNEIRTLNRFTTMYLDYAELQAERRQEMTLADWADQTDKFITFNEYPVLPDTGRISNQEAADRARERYALYDHARQNTLHGQQLSDQIDALKIIDQQIVAARRRLKRRD